MLRRTHAPPGRIFACSTPASTSPKPSRSAARRGETFRSCPTALPFRRSFAPGPLDRNLLTHHHTVATLAAPPAGGPFHLPLAALAGQLADFFLHQQLH